VRTITTVSTAEVRFGKEVKKERESCKISQEELGFEAEIHSSYVSQLERGLKSPSLGVILRISKALNVPASELLRRIENSK